MKRSVAKLLSVISVIIWVIVAFAFAASGNKGAVIISLLVYFPVIMVLNHFQRCPHCGAWPRRGSFFHEYCPHCGKPLDE